MIKFTQKGDFKKTQNFLQKARYRYYLKNLDKFAEEGVQALSLATPKDTGKTAASWYYTITQTKTGVRIDWCNSNLAVNEHKNHVDQINIALLIQYGHATGGKQNHGYVAGYDYINPAMRPIFDKIATDAWEELNTWSKPVAASFEKE